MPCVASTCSSDSWSLSTSFFLASSNSSVLWMASVSYLFLQWQTSVWDFERFLCNSCLDSVSSSMCSRSMSKSCREALNIICKLTCIWYFINWFLSHVGLRRPIRHRNFHEFASDHPSWPEVADCWDAPHSNRKSKDETEQRRFPLVDRRPVWKRK